MFVWAKARPFTSAVEPLGGLPGVEGGKLSFMVLYGTPGEKESPGRPFRDDPRNKLRGVVAVLEKSSTGRVDCEKLEPEMVLNLFGLSPGIRMRAPDGREVLVLADSEEKLVFFGVVDE